jgi:hypothetical protein
MPFTPGIYINRPEPMEAAQVTTDTASTLADWCGGRVSDDGGIILHTLTGRRVVPPGGWIVRRPSNGYWATYTASDFAARYDPAA